MTFILQVRKLEHEEEKQSTESTSTPIECYAVKRGTLAMTRRKGKDRRVGRDNYSLLSIHDRALTSHMWPHWIKHVFIPSSTLRSVEKCLLSAHNDPVGLAPFYRRGMGAQIRPLTQVANRTQCQDPNPGLSVPRPRGAFLGILWNSKVVSHHLPQKEVPSFAFSVSAPPHIGLKPECLGTC